MIILEGFVHAQPSSHMVVCDGPLAILPNIGARESHEARNKHRGLLAIRQPSTPGQSELPNTEVELNQGANSVFAC
jgi:hypothetical protein